MLSDAQMYTEVSLLSLFTDMLHHKLGKGHHRSQEGKGMIHYFEKHSVERCL